MATDDKPARQSSARFWIGYAVVVLVCGAIFFADVRLPRSMNDYVQMPTRKGWGAVCSYIVLVVFLSEILPGVKEKGLQLKDGSRLTYKINGLLVSLVTVAILASAVATGNLDGTFIADNLMDLWSTTTVFSIVFSLHLYIRAIYFPAKDVAKQGNFIHDFIMGSELNPHVLGINVKFFSYRPAMLGWMLVNLSFLCKQYNLFGFVTKRMFVYQLLSNFYILDYFFFETQMITTWDIIAENFGFMLVWADYFFIPMTFSLQNIFLWNMEDDVGTVFIICNVVMFVVGFVIFRGTNLQKHQFKTDPTKPIWGKTPETVGGRLLVSGYWGQARHINYLGDLLMALAFCMPCGLISGRGYFYFFYLLLLLLHRERRDEIRCKEKYGATWDAYCARVPYRIMPFVY